ncbi:MAG: DUF4032 domain-containing protein [Acidimicrobiales bacterium]
MTVRQRGISRHVVRFTSRDGVLYALKELPAALAERELRLLRRLAAESVPVVEVVGIVTDRGRHRADDGSEDDLDAVLITSYLDFSLPYRSLFFSRAAPDLVDRLLDALVELLVRLHLVGFFWGDCSLSNTLFRRDAGALAAYLVDAETAEVHPGLTDGQRLYDLALAEERVAGEMMDLAAAGTGVPGAGADDLDPVETANEVVRRYSGLWAELTREEVLVGGDQHRIETRIRRLNQLGFDVGEVTLVSDGTGDRLRLTTQVVEPGHHRRMLFVHTGLDVLENQARRLLNDIATYRGALERREGRPVLPAVAANRWLAEVFEPAIGAVPPRLRHKLEPAELYHQIIDHRWFLSEAMGHDVGTANATRSFVETVLPWIPDERTILAASPAPPRGGSGPAG